MDKKNRPQMISPDFLLSIKTAKFIRESNEAKNTTIFLKNSLQKLECTDQEILSWVICLTFVLSQWYCVILLTQSSIMTLNIKPTIQPHAEFPIQANQNSFLLKTLTLMAFQCFFHLWPSLLDISKSEYIACCQLYLLSIPSVLSPECQNYFSNSSE